jgi:hypothetical protein
VKTHFSPPPFLRVVCSPQGVKGPPRVTIHPHCRGEKGPLAADTFNLVQCWNELLHKSGI